MEPNEKDLALFVVRECERNPDHVGSFGWGGPGNRCLVARYFDAIGMGDKPIRWGALSGAMNSLACQVGVLNDSGVPWGEIPKRLGLVPGEMPAEAPTPEPAQAQS